MANNKKLNILYFVPHLETIYAGRTIFNGYKNAFLDTKNNFEFFTAKDNTNKILQKINPNILFISLNSYVLKFVDTKAIVEWKKKNNMKVFANVPFWESPMSKLRVNEAQSLSQDKYLLSLIDSGFGDVYYNASEQEDPRMLGFQKNTRYKHYTIPLAADKSIIFPDYAERFKADISFIGTYLPEKRKFFKEKVFPLKKNYDLKLYGQDWTLKDRTLGWIQRGGQYFNIPFIKSIQKPSLKLVDERKIYTSSLISINVHEEYQRKYGNDCNERTFKIPMARGFEITDDVACIRKYFKDGKEIIIAKNKNDWFEKIEYYIKNPDKRLPIIEAGRKRILKDHTYNNRVKSLVDIYNSL